MKKIVDLSHNQGPIDFLKAKNELSLAIIRVQSGSNKIDERYKEYVAGCKKHNIPFGHYAYFRAVSIDDAKVEAKDFLERVDKEAKFLVVDVEKMYLKNPKDIIAATQAFIDTCKTAGWKTGLYTGHSFYKEYNMNKVKTDFLWIPRYVKPCDGKVHSLKPDMPCHLWQFTENGQLSGVKESVDLNVLNGDLPLEWFTEGGNEVSYTLDDLLKKAKPKLKDVHPTIQAKALQLITKAFEKGYKLIITEGYRSVEYQNKLYAQGRTTSGNKVTNAKGGYSYHNFGLAFDIGVLDATEKDVDWDTYAKYKAVGQLGKALGLEWGGDWKTIVDNPHFQMTFGFTLAQLRAGKRPSSSETTSTVGISTIVELGSKGELTRKLQTNLNALGIAKLDVDGFAGPKTVEAIKAFQKANKLTVDGIAGLNTLSKIAELIAILNKPKQEDLPKVTSLGDKYSFQVKSKVAVGVYKYSNLAERQKTIGADTIFSVYGYTEGVKAYAVPGGFVQAEDVEPVPVTIKTGGLSNDMEAEFRSFLKGEGIDSELNVYSKGNPSAEITVAGLQLVKVKQFLDVKTWYYK